MKSKSRESEKSEIIQYTPSSQVEVIPEEKLEIRYIPLSQIDVIDDNARLHDEKNIKSIIKSFKKFGFRGGVKWDKNALVTDKKSEMAGGVNRGKGRIESLRVMQSQGDKAPRGILLAEKGDISQEVLDCLPDQEWLVPIEFGMDSKSGKEAKAFAIEDNITGLTNFTTEQIAELFDSDLLAEQLLELSETEFLPPSFEDDFESLLAKFNCEDEEDENSGFDYQPPEDNKNIDEDELAKTNCTCPNCGFSWKK